MTHMPGSGNAPPGSAVTSYRYAAWLYSGHPVVADAVAGSPMAALLLSIASSPSDAVISEQRRLSVWGGDLYYSPPRLNGRWDALPDVFRKAADNSMSSRAASACRGTCAV